MMKSERALLILIVILLWGCTNSPRIEENMPLKEFKAHLDKRVPEIMGKYKVPGLSLAILKNDSLLWTETYGMAEADEERRMQLNAIYRVESISKSVTAWGIMRLVEQGKIDLNRPVTYYLSSWEMPASNFDWNEVTVGRVLSNSSGIPLGTIGEEYALGEAMPTLRDYVGKEVQLKTKPGTKFAYSNAGFNLIELVIEEVTGKSFADYMKEEILTPLNMDRASFSWQDIPQPNIPMGYDLKGNEVPVYIYPANASGGLFSDINEIASFVGAGNYLNPDLLNLHSIQSMHDTKIEINGIFSLVADSYGYGHFIEELPNGEKAVWHGGQGHGWMTHFHLVPMSGAGIVILTNSQRSWPVISEILSEWAIWSGIEKVKMGRILYGVRILRIFNLIILLTSLWILLRLGSALYYGRRRFVPLSKTGLWSRTLMATFGFTLIGIIIWSTLQPYLMISSIFPGIIKWTGLSLTVLAVSLIFFPLFPRNDTTVAIKQGV